MLGNKQLLSVFFFVVILLAVFFVMGYMVGRSTGGDLAAKRNTAEQVQRTDSTTAMPRSGSPASDNKPLEVPQVVKSEAAPETAAQSGTTPESAPAASVPASVQANGL